MRPPNALLPLIAGVPSVAGTDEREFLFPSPREGQLVFRRDTTAVEEYRDGAWDRVIENFGARGVTRLLLEAANVSTSQTGSSSTPITGATVTLPAGTLSRDGDVVRIAVRYSFTLPGGEQATLFPTRVGTVGSIQVITTVTSGPFGVVFWCTRRGARAAVGSYNALGTSYAAPVSSLPIATLDWTVDQTVGALGSVNAGTGTITINDIRVELLQAP